MAILVGGNDGLIRLLISESTQNNPQIPMIFTILFKLNQGLSVPLLNHARIYRKHELISDLIP